MRPINAHQEVVPTFGIDPRGWSMFDALARAGQRALDGSIGGVRLGDTGRPEVSWNGYAANPQGPFTGLAPLGQNLGTARPVVSTTGELADQGGLAALSNPAMAAFAQRLKRGAS